jgi:DNA-binding NtrC family response regulator
METILFVDDERRIREAFAHELDLEGYSVITAGDASEGLDVLARRDVDLVVTDVRMPGGVRPLLLWITERMPGLPVIVHSADPGTLTEDLAASATALVDKGDGYEALLRAVQEALAAKPRPVAEGSARHMADHRPWESGSAVKEPKPRAGPSPRSAG